MGEQLLDLMRAAERYYPNSAGRVWRTAELRREWVARFGDNVSPRTRKLHVDLGIRYFLQPQGRMQTAPAERVSKGMYRLRAAWHWFADQEEKLTQVSRAIGARRVRMRYTGPNRATGPGGTEITYCLALEEPVPEDADKYLDEPLDRRPENSRQVRTAKGRLAELRRITRRMVDSNPGRGPEVLTALISELLARNPSHWRYLLSASLASVLTNQPRCFYVVSYPTPRQELAEGGRWPPHAVPWPDPEWRYNTTQALQQRPQTSDR